MLKETPYPCPLSIKEEWQHELITDLKHSFSAVEKLSPASTIYKYHQGILKTYADAGLDLEELKEAVKSIQIFPPIEKLSGKP
ncbi:MAG: hypothetical protein WC549_00535 [Actinomycetota bacterium]